MSIKFKSTLRNKLHPSVSERHERRSSQTDQFHQEIQSVPGFSQVNSGGLFSWNHSKETAEEELVQVLILSLCVTL